MTPYLVEHYGLSEENAGIIFTMAGICMILGVGVIRKLSDKAGKHWICFACYLGSAFTNLLIGPIAPDSLGWTLTGVGL
jgi:predicted MFS family arabinose efflux permease